MSAFFRLESFGIGGRERILFVGFLLMLCGMLAGCTTESGMRKINAHESLRSVEELPKLREAMKEHGIVRTLLIGHYAEVFREGVVWDKDVYALPNNDFVLNLAAENPEEFSAMVIVNPEDPDVLSRLEEYLRRGAIGVQVYASSFERGMDDPAYGFFFQYLESHHVPLYIRMTVKKGENFNQLDAVLNAYQYLRVLVPHFMVAEDKSDMLRYLLLKHDRLHFDMSYGFKKWRTDHLRKVSEHRDALRDLFLEFPDRILFGTDVVISDEEWKTGEYVRASYADYVALLESEEFVFSLTGERLRGFHLPKEILRKIHRENFESFFGEDIILDANETYLTAFPSSDTGTVVREASVLLSLIGNIFSPIETVLYEGGSFVLPEQIRSVLIDNRLEGRLRFSFPQEEFLSREEILTRLSEEQNAWGILILDDVTPHVRTIAVNGFHPFQRSARVQRSALGEYPLSFAVEDGLVTEEILFDPYRYVSVLITGSSLIGQGMQKEERQYGIEQLGANIRSMMRDSDITHLSLETSFVEGCHNDVGGFLFCTDSVYFDLLPYLGVDVIGLTGNHLTDFGRDNFVSALRKYRDKHILHYGGGRNNSLEENTAKFNLFGKKIAFIGYNDISGSRGIATERLAGSRDYVSDDALKQDLFTLRAETDLLLMDVQAGTEFAPEPTYYQRHIASQATALGVDAVQFLHAHSMKGFEFFGDAPAVYGPGNFLFFHPSSEKFDTQHAYAMKYIFDGSRLVQLEFLPVDISDHDLTPGGRLSLLPRLKNLSAPLTGSPEDFSVHAFSVNPEYLPASWMQGVVRRFGLVPQQIPPTVHTESPQVFVDGDLSVLNDRNTYVLFSFKDVASFESFLDAVQKNPKRYTDLFIRFANKILFGGNLFENSDCSSDLHKRFLASRTLTAYRNMLEREEFAWPDLDFCKSEWSYDYRKETPFRGLRLPVEVLHKIYFENAASF